MDINNKVGVVDIGPTSPFSGGAILGDRWRFQKHAQIRMFLLEALV